MSRLIAPLLCVACAGCGQTADSTRKATAVTESRRPTKTSTAVTRPGPANARIEPDVATAAKAAADAERRKRLQREFDLLDDADDRRFVMEAGTHFREHPHDVAWLVEKSSTWAPRGYLALIGRFRELVPEITSDDYRDAATQVGDGFGARRFAANMGITNPDKLQVVRMTIGTMTPDDAMTAVECSKLIAAGGYQSIPPSAKRVIRAYPDIFEAP